MAKKTKAQKETEAVEAERVRRAALTDEERAAEDAKADKEVADAIPADGKNYVTVTYPGGSRVYSKELHGKDFKALAKEFAEKKGGTVA